MKVSDCVQIDPEVKVSDIVEGEEHIVEPAEKENVATDVVPKEEEDELTTAETSGSFTHINNLLIHMFLDCFR